MKKVMVPLGDRSYDILIGPHLLTETLFNALQESYGKVIVVSDETVWQLHGTDLESSLNAARITFNTVLVPAGEKSKSLSELEKILNFFAGNGLGRDGLVIAFGGGVIGDLAGFAASIWMRGVRYIQIPTTLLAMVDSSVGGKTAVNLNAGKNLVGTFWQPSLVIADTSLLKTLPEREWRCGLSEMIKYGALFSPSLFEELASMENTDRLPELIEICCYLKSDTVQADERDNGQRMLLNYGHTFGHAVEKLGDFEQFNHGEAVAIGMMLAATVGERIGITKLESNCKSQLEKVLTAHGLPINCPFSANEMLQAMMMDKKAHDGGIELILLEDIGKASIVWKSAAELQALLIEVLGNE